MERLIKVHDFKSNFGELIIGEFEGEICLCDWRFRLKREQIDKRLSLGLNAKFIRETSSLHLEVIDQLNEYFLGKRKLFQIPIRPIGSEFQMKVWKELQNIPYGNTISYLQLSRICGDEKAIRAVASANGANAISIIIPCHRVIAGNGDLQGYAGGLQTKKKLLELEGSYTQISFQL